MLMRAARFHEHGGPEVLRLEDVPVPVPGPGELRIEVRAAALNHLDLWVRRGLPIETTMPHVGGSDVAGVVEAVGEGVDPARLGERVVVNPSLACGRCRECARGEESMCPGYRILGEHTDGGFAERLVVRASRAYALPDHVAMEEAAALPISYMTAWRALVSRAALRPGEDVLVIGASGGTALAAVQVARLAGARVYAVTRGAERAERIRALGADVVYDRGVEDWAAALRRDTGGRGADVVVENVGEPTWTASLRSLARGGRLVTYGATAGAKVSLDLRALFWRQVQVIGTTMASRAEFEEVLRLFLAGRIRPVVDSVLPLERVREAHVRLESGDHLGKIVLVP
jgi:NADPH:quinone reductase-like Zn-dependent oxidoreductase